MERETGSGAPRGYALCGEPRCGSTYLARLLASTGVLGRPREYFSGHERVKAANRDPEAHLAEWIERTATPNGVYALKMFTEQFDLVERSRWAVRLPNLKFVHIERRDLLGQAISLVKAHQTLAFESKQAPRREPAYSRRSIAATLARMAHSQARWHCWFSRNGIAPLRLTYEDIARDPDDAVRRVAGHIGIAAPPAVSGVDMEIQRDRVSAEWRERFVSESADLTYLDDLLWRIRPTLRRWRARVF